MVEGNLRFTLKKTLLPSFTHCFKAINSCDLFNFIVTPHVFQTFSIFSLHIIIYITRFFPLILGPICCLLILCTIRSLCDPHTISCIVTYHTWHVMLSPCMSSYFYPWVLVCLVGPKMLFKWYLWNVTNMWNIINHKKTMKPKWKYLVQSKKVKVMPMNSYGI